MAIKWNWSLTTAAYKGHVMGTPTIALSKVVDKLQQTLWCSCAAALAEWTLSDSCNHNRTA